jgi:monoamine oxidase
MNRNDFLKQLGLLSVGGLMLPSTLLSCRKEKLFGSASFDGKVLIIGAGAAGLYAGYLLKAQGVDFTILEAAPVYGGRMGKLSGFADYDVDTGAQWLHGRNNILGDLIQKNKVPTTLDDSELSYWFENELVNNLPKDPFIFEEYNLPDISFKDYAEQQGFGPEYANIMEAIAGDQGAAADEISAYWNSKDEENWVSGDEDFKFQNTFFDFINQYIAQEVANNIELNTVVTEINYQGSSVLITDSNNKQWTADKVIVSVPISILKLNEIAFTPSLPAEKTAAFTKFGMGPGMKVFLKFSNKFYEPALYGGAICGAYVDDTLGKNTNDHVLLAFVMGKQAAYLHGLGSDVAITNALLARIGYLFPRRTSYNQFYSF